MNDKLEDTKPRPALNIDSETPPAEDAPPVSPEPIEPTASPATPVNPMQAVPPQFQQGQQPPYYTQPRPQQIEHGGPPRWLFWGVILVFVMGMIGLIGAFVGFRFVLEPAQQERVMQVLPFMEAFLGPRPQPGDTLPTPSSAIIEDLSPEDLLSGLSFSATATPEPAAEITEEAVETVAPTATPTATATSTPVTEAAPPAETPVANVQTQQVAVEPTVSTAAVLPRSTRLTGFNYQKQTWNNCGPANITMALSFYGWQQDQAYAATYLKPGGREDKNVSPHEMVSFVNNRSDLTSVYRVGGTIEMMKELLANNIPVVIESGSMPEAYEWIGHYRLLVGYDDNQGIFYILDSFIGSENPGAGVVESYPAFDTEWKQFNRTFIVVYEPQREALVNRILSEYTDERVAAEIALRTATAEATADDRDAHAWFNMGSSLTLLGNYEQAALAFDKALATRALPWRMLWYQFGPYEAYIGAGRAQEVLGLATVNMNNGGDYVEETHYWNGRALEALGRRNEAASAYRRALMRNPQYAEATSALNALGL